MQQVQSAAGLDSPEALHQLGQLFRAGLQQPAQLDGRQLAGLRRHLKPLGGLPAAELDALEAALPGAPPWPGPAPADLWNADGTVEKGGEWGDRAPCGDSTSVLALPGVRSAGFWLHCERSTQACGDARLVPVKQARQRTRPTPRCTSTVLVAALTALWPLAGLH